MVSTIEELDEMRAKVLYDSIYTRKYDNGYWNTELLCCIEFVRAIREADERAGLVTVPKVPTSEMFDGGINGCPKSSEDAGLYGVWAGMISSSPFAKKGDA